MHILVRTTHPSNEILNVIDVYTSQELPKRPDYVKELASFWRSTNAGSEATFIFEIPDEKASEYMKAVNERNAYMQTRLANLNTEIIVGMSVPDAIQSVAGLRQR